MLTPTMTTPLYAAVLAIFYIYLSLRIVRLRRRLRVSLGTGNEPQLERAMRAHGNFIEYVPLCLILMASAEFLQTFPIWLMHIVGLTLLIARGAHVIGVQTAKGKFQFRVFGVVTTITLIGVLALVILFKYVSIYFI